MAPAQYLLLTIAMAQPQESTLPKRFAVLGHPIAHSKSPMIHKLFARQFKHHTVYTAIDVKPGEFVETVEKFRGEGGVGVNVTIPYKLEAYYLATNLSDRAKVAEAVNTLRFEKDGGIFGDNTDGAGLVFDITRNLNIAIKDNNVLILGAGGAVRGVLLPLLKQHPKQLTIANRTIAKARDLATEFAQYGEIEGCGFDDLKGRRYDVVINGTSASLQGEVPPLPPSLFTHGGLAYDMMYGDFPTVFMSWAGQVGVGQVSDGLGMLVEQAAESYFVWTGDRPATQPVIQQLRKGL
jgi:shikimate dehydrogenase